MGSVEVSTRWPEGRAQRFAELMKADWSRLVFTEDEYRSFIKGYEKELAFLFEEVKSKRAGRRGRSDDLKPVEAVKCSGAPDDDVTFIRLPRVLAITGVSKTTIYEWMRDKSFPASHKLGRRAVAWYEHEIRRWARER
jgi:prophage regulatory protein